MTAPSAPPFPLREAHAHLPAMGAEMAMLALADCRDRGDVLARVATRAAALASTREPGWLIATGLRPSAWPDPRWPGMSELDAACPARPCMVVGFDHHSGAVNSAAFAAIGFTPTSPSPPGGLIQRDRSGWPTGLLLEAAFNAARLAAPAPTHAQWLDHLRAACRALAGMGFVEAHDLLSPPWLGPALAELARAGELPLRVSLFPRVEDLPGIAATSASWRSDRLTLAGGKIFVDGTLNSRTAWMIEPFRDPIPEHPCGTPLMTVAQIADALSRCAALGLGLAAHAIGDAAVRAVLDAVQSRPRERASTRPPAPAGGSDGSLRIEHAELIDERDIPRFAELGVVCSVQPCHLLCDVEVLREQLPHRLDRVLPLRDLIAAGLVPGRTLIFGSDVPIVRADPQDSILAATLRRRPDMPVAAAVAPAQALTEREAWACFASGRGPISGPPGPPESHR